MKAYCSRLWTIFGRAALMSVTTAQGEGGLENREGEERDETWILIITSIAMCLFVVTRRYTAIQVPVLPTPALQ